MNIFRSGRPHERPQLTLDPIECRWLLWLCRHHQGDAKVPSNWSPSPGHVEDLVEGLGLYHETLEEYEQGEGEDPVDIDVPPF